ncbi:U1 zinc finger-domain-containing protein [Dipodascopsis tothii]|uniref:U1 zinc finger-domain-containing protein n=1 Tax=Dipodascopsis tothii TaxID=44089 RepID=UPI0034D011C5
MPKYYCDYCEVFLTHDSISVRRAHNSGRNHIKNVIDYYQQISQEQAQAIIDSITAQYAEQRTQGGRHGGQGRSASQASIVNAPTGPSSYSNMPPGFVPPPPPPGMPEIPGGLPPPPPHVLAQIRTAMARGEGLDHIQFTPPAHLAKAHAR